MKRFSTLVCLVTGIMQQVQAQHNNELFNDGALIHVETGAEIYVRGDVHMNGSTGTLENYGFIQVEGNMYSDNQFQQRGTGTVRLYNQNVNIGQPQFISGSYAVRGGQAQIGVDDGSFFNLELANDVGIVYLVGVGNVTDVRNSVDFDPLSGTVNRIVTHDYIGSGFPANGANYDAVFGLMNSAAGEANLLNNTIATNGNMSTIDNGYIQGNFRRAISAAGGVYGFVLGLEPADDGAARGVQFSRLDFGVNNYDVITGYFQQGSSNVITGSPVQCTYNIDYFGGADHGEWIYNDITGSGTGTYEIGVWPQDDNFGAQTVWLITKDDTIQGTANQCGPSPVGLTRGGLTGFSQFGLAGGSSEALPVELIYIDAKPVNNEFIRITWGTAVEINNSGFELQRSEDGMNFTPITWVDAQGNTTERQDYTFHDRNVVKGQLYYYRVKQVDFDGTESFTPIVNATLIPNQVSILLSELVPNPADNYTQFIVSAEEILDAEIILINELGQVVSNKAITVNTGDNSYQINTSLLAVGTYHVVLQTKEQRHVKRLMVVR